MDITIKKDVKKNVFSVTIRAIPTKTEQDKLKKFGDPIVQIGGTFNNIVVPDEEKKLPSQFPIILNFDGEEYGNSIASEAGNEWEAEMRVRLRHAMTEFKAIPDNFTGEEKFTI